MDPANIPKVDPGWNDPPMLKYDASNPPPKSRIMNKRVAFPLSTSSTSTTTTQAPTSNTPPMIPPLPVPAFSIENTKEHLGNFFISNDSRNFFEKLWDTELDDNCKKLIKMMAECLVKNNKSGAELHKQELLTLNKTHECWMKDVKF